MDIKRILRAIATWPIYCVAAAIVWNSSLSVQIGVMVTLGLMDIISYKSYMWGRK